MGIDDKRRSLDAVKGPQERTLATRQRMCDEFVCAVVSRLKDSIRDSSARGCFYTQLWDIRWRGDPVAKTSVCPKPRTRYSTSAFGSTTWSVEVAFYGDIFHLSTSKFQQDPGLREEVGPPDENVKAELPRLVELAVEDAEETIADWMRKVPPRGCTLVLPLLLVPAAAGMVRLIS